VEGDLAKAQGEREAEEERECFHDNR